MIGVATFAALVLAQVPAAPAAACPSWARSMTPPGGTLLKCEHVDGSGRTEANFEVPGADEASRGAMGVKLTKYQPALWSMVKAGLPERLARVAKPSAATPDGEWVAGERAEASEHADFAGGKARYVRNTVQGVQAEPRTYYSCTCMFSQDTTVVEISASAADRKSCEAWFSGVLKALPR